MALNLGNLVQLPEVKTQVEINKQTQLMLFALAGMLVAGAVVTAAIATRKGGK